jgi:hypothetical protein
MDAPTTLREEIRQLLASSEPLTRGEIYEKCKLAGDEATLSTVLSQLCTAGDIKKAGERERVGARALALYTRAVYESAGASGGGRVKARKKPGPKPAKRKARGPYKKRAKPAKTRSPRLQKVQRRNADSPELAPGFRCALFSDGSMDIERAGDVFQLSEPEVRVLFAYLEKLPEVHP